MMSYLLVALTVGCALISALHLPLDVHVIIPGFVGKPMPSTITLCGPAFATGFDRLRQTYSILNFSHTYLYDPKADDCNRFSEEYPNMISRWLYKTKDPNSLPVIVSPSCVSQTNVYNQIASEWKILVITTAVTDIILHNKSLAPTWITTNLYPMQQYGEAYYGLLKMNNWTSVFILQEQGPFLFYDFVRNQTEALLRRQNVHVALIQYLPNIKLDFGLLLDEFTSRSRVMLFFGPPNGLRKLLIEAHARNMTNGDYVYVVVIPFPYKRYGVFTYKANDKDDEVVREAYRSVLRYMAIDLSRDTSTNLSTLRTSWNELYTIDSFYGNLNLTEKPPLPMLGPPQSALEMLGQILNETMTLTPNFDTKNGTELAKKFWNRTFYTHAGRVTLDEYGDRTPFMSVAFFTDAFKVYLESDIRNGQFKWDDLGTLIWHGGSSLPPNQPYCGYTGRKPYCQKLIVGLLEGLLFGAAAVLLCGTGLTLTYGRKYATRNLVWFVLDPKLLVLQNAPSTAHSQWYRCLFHISTK